jgi:hypothetical protein
VRRLQPLPRADVKVWIQGYGEHELNDVSLDWRPQAPTLTLARNRYYWGRRFPRDNGPQILNPIDKCKCVKCAQKEENT